MIVKKCIFIYLVVPIGGRGGGEEKYTYITKQYIYIILHLLYHMVIYVICMNNRHFHRFIN